MAVTDWKVSDISVLWAPFAAPTLAAFGRLLPEVPLLIASNLCASDIRGLLCTCRLLRCAEGLAAKRKLHCTQAAFDIIAAARLDSEKDEAAEYLASAECVWTPSTARRLLTTFVIWSAAVTAKPGTCHHSALSWPNGNTLRFPKSTGRDRPSELHSSNLGCCL